MAERTFSISIVHHSRKEILEAAEAGPASRLTFDFLADLSPVLPIGQAVETYYSILAQTTITPVLKDAMLPLWLHAHLHQDRILEIAAFAPLRVEGISWRWPFFERWVDKFKELGIWPERLNYVEGEAKDRRYGLYGTKSQLLAQWLTSRLCARRDAAGYRHGDIFDRWGWQLKTEGDNNARLVADLAGIVRLGDAETYPPFFPGDTSWLRLNSRPNSKEDAV